MGLSDEMKLHYEEVLQGTYYSVYPELPRDKGVGFHYDIIDESDRQYAKLLDNIKGERTVITISTLRQRDILQRRTAVFGRLWALLSISSTKTRKKR